VIETRKGIGRVHGWLFALALPAFAAADVPVDSPGGAADGVAALVAERDVERTQQAEDLLRFDRLSRQLTEVTSRVQGFQVNLGSLVRQEAEDVTESLDALVEQLALAESLREDLVRRQATLVEQLRARMRRIVLLDEQIEALRDRGAEQAGPLSGSWTLVLLPAEQRGTAELRQSGTLVSGTYQLAGGWSGSLQGTLVNRKVHLVRIDSRLGRSMEFEGVLSADGRQIRGTWRSYELADGAGSSGQWSARRDDGPGAR